MSPSAEGGTAKRVKPSSNGTTVKPQHSATSTIKRPRLFQPFRALGLITDNVPFVLNIKHGGKDAVKPDVFIYTCIGNSWMMWDADRMTLLFVGEAIQSDIRALLVVSGSSGQDIVLAATERKVCKFVRGKLVDVFATSEEDNDDKSDLTHIMAVGDNLLALSSGGRAAYVWSLSQNSLLRRLPLERPVTGTSDTFTASSMIHPSTYIDKVLFGSAQGHLQLYNFRTATLLHTFTRTSLLAYMGLAEAMLEPGESFAIVDMVQTPAIDVIAIVFEAGYVLLLDIRYDEPIMYARAARGNVSQGNILGRSAVTFRSDGLAHTMAVGTRLGDIILFDLESSGPSSNDGRARPARLAHTIRTAHDAAIASVQFLQGQPLLMSSGADNAIKQWFFEVSSITGAGELGGASSSFGAAATAPPRLLKSREGHSAPPRLIRYIGEAGRTIISAGGDDRSVRAISVVRDSRSAELSQGSVQKKAKQIARPVISLKLQPATSIAHSSTRSRDWDDLVTTHSGLEYAQTWSTRNNRIGAHHLRSVNDAKGQMSQATVTQISACGNFAMVGNLLGFVEVFNIQSGRYRRRLDPRDTQLQKVAKKLKGGMVQWSEQRVPIDGSPITGIVSDSINKTVAVSTIGGTLHFFDFHTGNEITRVVKRAGISAIELHRASNLVAAVHDDHTVALYDMETYKMVRLFTGFGDVVLDVTFAPDGRWLIASCNDGIVRTFDIPTGRLVDYFATAKPALSVTFSPLGNFLATVHQDSRGIFLWANRNQYLNLALSGIDDVQVRTKDAMEVLPTLRGIDLDALADEDAQLKELDVGEAQYQRTYTSKPQLFVSAERGDKTSVDDRERGGLLTLSTMPRSRWMTLLNLDLIRARNKPKEAPKKPELAPFFLPTSASSVPDSLVERHGVRAPLGQQIEDDGEGEEDVAASRRLQTIAAQGGLDVESAFSRRLAGALQDDQMDALFTYLHALAPPTLDAEIRSLVRVTDVTRFLQCMTRRLQQHLDYDAVQAMVAVVLRVHGDLIVAHGRKGDIVQKQNGQSDGMDADYYDHQDDDDDGYRLAEAMRSLMAEQYREGNRLLDLVQYAMGSLAFVRDMPLA